MTITSTGIGTSCVTLWSDPQLGTRRVHVDV